MRAAEREQISVFDLERRRVRSIPDDQWNAVISHDCLARVGPTVLRESGLFYNFTRGCDCSEWSNICECSLSPTWRLDLNPALAVRGMLLPIHGPEGFFVDLLVFRHIRDERPFRLEVRANKGMAA